MRALVLTVTLLVALGAGEARAQYSEQFLERWNQAHARREAAAQPYLDRGGVVVDSGDTFVEDETPSIMNTGAEAVLIIGCEDRCRGMSLLLRSIDSSARAQNSSDNPHLLVLDISPDMRGALSNWLADIDVDCRRRGRECQYVWSVVATSPQPDYKARGVSHLEPSAWESGQDSTPGVTIGWLAMPTLEHLEYFYPPLPHRRSQEGDARLQCVVIEGGRLSCRRWQETTIDFGDAALRLSSVLRVAETDSAGIPTLGRKITAPISFRLD